jgi:hypothetical protein
MKNAIPRDEYMRQLYEQDAQEQRELAERVRVARGDAAQAADFERWAAALEQLAANQPQPYPEALCSWR